MASIAMDSSSSASLLHPPPVVPMKLHAENREKLLKHLREYLNSSSRPLKGFVLLQGGEEQTRYCTDHEDLFRQESYFAYLFGVREPGFYGAIDVDSGKSILFAPRLPAEYAVWMGEIKPLSYFEETYMVSKAYYTDEITQVLNNQYQGSGKPLLFLLHGLNTDSQNFSKPAEFEGIEKFETDLKILHPILAECRVLKSKLELAVIQYANDISSEAHVEVMRKIKPGMKEYQLESIFLHHTYFYGSCRHCSYTCICATGNNSSVLHYGHAAAPNDRTFQDGDMALLDMGAEFCFYGSDITCSYPVNGKFTSNQRLIYNAVLDAHDAVISSMKPGVNWVDMHKLAEKIVLQALKKGSLLVGDVDEMMVERLGSVFMPHGLGHLMGLDTHDVGGYLQGAERPEEPGLSSLRTSRDLLEGMVITVEPGCYFIDALLLPAMESAKTSKFFNGEAIAKFRGFGGVRIESDLYVTADGCLNMTKVPRKIEDIEAVMGGAPWPIKKSMNDYENGGSLHVIN
ncbi:putative xaa-Pro dipeptidase [Helianthus annuus]|uniref:Xaa-Pro dipeptidase n=1 Tax=Helianthus annuus TaxID=4232 RepID=A0A251TRV2_HELAN|nr:xaa-Pro dipeptidase [Helianthus annuus]KAF5788555.1 putative xaa-Pro dipeptidase [Helianthus annuus]KAJ0515596.1 putative xaa-Pro dipeptidase [Helianthus annuus]KAJ0524157.1 putative xaa-Pro dipeptidase [Helianthus annuus]KAJ0531777.1 putative xaa-Pro dipeptidase [Helianthus annuus]